jgi:L-amino acid N-acyltransferase YncA
MAYVLQIIQRNCWRRRPKFIVTFEEEAVTVAEIARRIEDVWSASLPWLVAEESRRVVGYAYATKWRTRSPYRHSAEITVYLAPEDVGRGVGSQLCCKLEVE